MDYIHSQKSRRKQGFFPSTILFEDEYVMAMVKPPELPTANAPKGTESLFTLVQAYLPTAAFVGVVSRLDALVSGVVVMAKTKASAAGLSKQFRERTVKKCYRAVCTGRFPAPIGKWVEWRDELVRQTVSDGLVTEKKQHADVRCRVLKRAGEVCLVELNPSSGRKHQLRTQLSHYGCPIVGDRRYGSRLPFPAGIALHSALLECKHPHTGQKMCFEAPLPETWKNCFPALFS